MKKFMNVKHAYLIPLLLILCLLPSTSAQGATEPTKIRPGVGGPISKSIGNHNARSAAAAAAITSPNGPSLRICKDVDQNGLPIVHRVITYRAYNDQLVVSVTTQVLKTKETINSFIFALNSWSDNTPAVACTGEDASTLRLVLAWHSQDGTNNIYSGEFLFDKVAGVCKNPIDAITCALTNKGKVGITTPNAPILNQTSSDVWLTWRGNNNLLYMVRKPFTGTSWIDKVSFPYTLSNAPNVDVFVDGGIEKLFVSWPGLESSPRINMGSYNPQTKTLTRHLLSTATTRTRINVATIYPSAEKSGGPGAIVTWRGADNLNIYMNLWLQTTLNWAGDRVIATDGAGNNLQSSSPVAIDALEYYNDSFYITYTDAHTNEIMFYCFADSADNCFFL